MILENFLINTHPSFHNILLQSLSMMDVKYLQQLQSCDDCLPAANLRFAAFSMPRQSIKYILLGESPYPRARSANGYAFWDGAVGALWSPKGFSKEVNRATSLRNFIKMLLNARGDLRAPFTQESIAALDKTKLVQTGEELFSTLLGHGFLLLNASLIYSPGKVAYHARHWRPFIQSLIQQLLKANTELKWLLLGKIAQQIVPAERVHGLVAEHPYNISFITNQDVLKFFKPLNIMVKHDK